MKPRPPNVRARLYTVLMVLALAGTGLLVRAFDLQVLRKDFYQHQGDARFLREIAIPTSRGMITDRHGEPLAVSTPVESIWANPRVILSHRDRLPQLAGALGMPEDVLEQRLAQRADREFVYLRRHLGPDAAQAILDLGVPGVNSQREFRRFYPGGEVLAHVIGYTNIDDNGQEGLELAFDEWLTGRPGSQRVIRDRLGRVVENVELVSAPQPGRDLALTIDRRIQYLAYRELKVAVMEHQAASGSVVVLDVASGEILAMVNTPSYNPNSRGNSEPAARRNRAVTDVLEPGSVIKPFTVIAGLESGQFRPETMIDTTPGRMQVARHIVRDVRDFGPVDMTRLLTKSSNVAAVRIAMALPNEHLHDTFRRFGFGEFSGCGFPGESAGVLPSPRSWGVLEKATLSYGYGLSATPLQVAQAYAALGNGGRLRAPTFVRGALNPETAVIDPQLAASVVKMLESVTGREGTAQLASIPNYRVAGKTGTSRKAVAGGYQSRYISLFAGLVPASRPRLAAVVVIHDPAGQHYYAGLVAAPAYSRIMEGSLRLLDVPPDDVQTWYAATPLPSSVIAVEDLRDIAESVAEAPQEGVL